MPATTQNEARVGGNGHGDADAFPASLRRRVELADRRVQSFIREQPVVCLTAAAAIGWLLGKLASRRS